MDETGCIWSFLAVVTWCTLNVSNHIKTWTIDALTTAILDKFDADMYICMQFCHLTQVIHRFCHVFKFWLLVCLTCSMQYQAYLDERVCCLFT